MFTLDTYVLSARILLFEYLMGRLLQPSPMQFHFALLCFALKQYWGVYVAYPDHGEA